MTTNVSLYKSLYIFIGAQFEPSQENTLKEEPVSPVHIQSREPQFKSSAPKDAIGIASGDITTINVEYVREENEKCKSVKKGNTTRTGKHPVRLKHRVTLLKVSKCCFNISYYNLMF